MERIDWCFRSKCGNGYSPSDRAREEKGLVSDWEDES